MMTHSLMQRTVSLGRPARARSRRGGGPRFAVTHCADTLAAEQIESRIIHVRTIYRG